MVMINVCIGSACHIKGSYNIISTLQQAVEERGLGDDVELKAMFCTGHCTQAVSVTIDEEDTVHSVSGASAKSFFETEILPRIRS